ncbi:MAG: S41 family peptidase [Pseudomonadota bacterium]
MMLALMHKMRGFVLVVAATVMAFALMFPAAKPAHATTFSTQDVRSDLKLLRTLLRAYHPNLYTHTRPKQLNARFNAVMGSVKGPMDFWNAAVKAQQMMAAVCDEHTSIRIDHSMMRKHGRPGARTRERVEHPVPLVVSPNRIFADVLGNTRDLPKKKIFDTYRGLTPKELHSLIKSIEVHDGCLQDKPLHTTKLSITTQLLLSTALQSVDTLEKQDEPEQQPDYTASTEQPASTENDATPPAEPLAELGITINTLLTNHRKEFHNHYSTVAKKLGMRFLNPKKRNLPVWSRYTKDGKTAVVVVETLTSTKLQQQVTDRVLRLLIDRAPDNVILDLSRLPGGSVNEASRILSYFLRRSHRTAQSYHRRSISRAQLRRLQYSDNSRRDLEIESIRQFRRARRKGGLYTLRSRAVAFGNPSYRGKIMVLVSPDTRSAATIMALILQQQANATVVGYQNGGDTETSCFAAPGLRTLPKTGIRVAVPTTCYRRSRVKGKRGGPLKVDIEVSPETVGSGHFFAKIYEAAADALTQQP